MTQKLALLSPDFDTVWNYRREIILALNETKSPEEKYKFYLGELLSLVKLMKENPKSYTLWGHRQWVILEGLKIEKYMTDEQLSQAGGGILNNEIRLCEKMLTADERNFHCWNYRGWIVNTQLEHYDECYPAKIEEEKSDIEKSSTEEELIDTSKSQEETSKKTLITAGEKKLQKLKDEFDMTTSMLEKNFSNFSAWHYRGKLLIKIHKNNGSVYQIPLNIIEEELEKIKHAIFTEPNDQSPWNYHRWLISLLTPVYVVSIKLIDDNKSIEVEFSTVIKNSDKLRISINDIPCKLVSKSHKPESKFFFISIPPEVSNLNENSLFNIKIDNDSTEGKMESMDGQTFFKNVDIIFNSDKSITSNNKITIDLQKYMKSIDELLEVEEDLELAKQYKLRQEKRINELNTAI